jgi:glycerol transport system ATP-binding protein
VNVDSVLNGVRINGQVSVAEISGSESVVHFELAGSTWVSLAHGVQSRAVGEQAGFALDVDRALYFDAAGRRLAA